MAALPIGSLPAARRPVLRLVRGERMTGEVATAACRAPAPAISARPPARIAAPAPRPARPRTLVRRFAPGLLTLCGLAGLWWSAGALAGLRSAPAAGVRAPGATLVAGQAYVVRSGDTLWSIAVRLDPAGDPRPIVDRLDAELGGGTLQPGEVLQLP